jgi:hypothetical protein
MGQFPGLFCSERPDFPSAQTPIGGRGVYGLGRLAVPQVPGAAPVNSGSRVGSRVSRSGSAFQRLEQREEPVDLRKDACLVALTPAVVCRPMHPLGPVRIAVPISTLSTARTAAAP